VALIVYADGGFLLMTKLIDEKNIRSGKIMRAIALRGHSRRVNTSVWFLLAMTSSLNKE